MADRKLRYSRYFKKGFSGLPQEIADETETAIRELEQGNLQPSRRPKKRKPKKLDIWQIRITLNYRLTYRNDGDVIELLAVGTHDEIERRDR